MREVNEIKRNKRILQLKDLEEFKKGEWLKAVPNDEDFLEVNFKSNNNILIISTMKAKSVKEYMEEKKDEQ
jgi:hypothetical protein